MVLVGLRFVESVVIGQHRSMKNPSDKNAVACLTVEDHVASLFDTVKTWTLPIPESSHVWGFSEMHTEQMNLFEV